MGRGRKRSEKSYSQMAVALAAKLHKETGVVPTQKRLRELLGGGSKRDIVAATTALRAAIPPPFSAPAENFDRDAETVETLKAQLAKALAREEVTRQEHEGLRIHLLRETARIRDEISASSKVHLGFRPARSDPDGDNIFE